MPTLMTEGELISFTIVLVLIFLLGFFGNILVCLAIYNDYRLRQQVSNIFIFNLALTDLVTVLMIIPFCVAAMIHGDWMFGKSWCLATAFLYYTLAIVALGTLAFISLDRFYAIVRPLRYQMFITAPRAKLMLFASWIWASLFTLPCTFLGWFHYGQYESMCTFTFTGTGDEWKQRVMVYGVVTVLLCIVLPFLILLVCYVRIFRIVRLQSNRVAAQGPPAGFRPRVGVHKGYRTISLVVMLFLLSWAPFCVTRLAKILSWNHELIPPGVDTFSTVFSFLSAATNPIVYGLGREEFRRAFRKLYRQLRSYALTNRGKDEKGATVSTELPMELQSF